MGRIRIVLAWALVVVATVALTIALSLSVDAASGLFASHRWLAFAFPVVGVATWFVYRVLKVPFTWGTKHVIGNAECEGEVSARLAPAIFFGTCLTILAGGSVGKEAAALQMGGGVAASVGRLFDVDEESGRLLCACSLSGALAVLLGAPLAGSLFAVEAMQYRTRRAVDYAAIVVAAFVAKAASMGLSLDALSADVPLPSLSGYLLVCVLTTGFACAALAIAFCWLISRLRSLTGRGSVQVPVLVGAGVAACVFVCFFGGGAYSGTGMAQTGEALAGNVTGPFFAGKALFTLFVLGAGFKGGEIMPTLCVGATLGGFLGGLLGVSPVFCAAVALAAYFGACTNCPAASILLACEAFGFWGVGWYTLAVLVAYAISFRFSFYDNTELYPEAARAMRSRLKEAGR